MRGHFFWRIALLVVLLIVFTVGGCTLIFWSVVGLPGGHGGSPPPPFLLYRGGLIVVLLIGAVGFALTGRALRRVTAPIGDLMEAASRVSAGDYSPRVSERGPREMRALARAFNAMAERLKENEENRRGLLADVTHELRTPLTVIQGNLEGMIDGLYPADGAHLTPVLEEARVLSRLIDDLSTLSLSEGGALQLHKEPTDLGVLVNDVVAAFRMQAQAGGVRLSADVAESVPQPEVDPARMREVLSNLVANALRYTPRGGTVELRATANSEGRGVTLAVADTGHGIPAEALPHVFDRFYKSKDSPGSGLGLAIAKTLVLAHGGEIVAQSEPGQGTTIRVTLPLEPNP